MNFDFTAGNSQGFIIVAFRLIHDLLLPSGIIPRHKVVFIPEQPVKGRFGIPAVFHDFRNGDFSTDFLAATSRNDSAMISFAVFRFIYDLHKPRSVVPPSFLRSCQNKYSGSIPKNRNLSICRNTFQCLHSRLSACFLSFF